MLSVFCFVELNVQDEQGRTSLHWAVEKDQQQSCELLLELGADPNILNSALISPLHLAVTKRYNHLVEVSHTHAADNLFGLLSS